MAFSLKKGNGKSFKLHTAVAAVLPKRPLPVHILTLIFPTWLKIMNLDFLLFFMMVSIMWKKELKHVEIHLIKWHEKVLVQAFLCSINFLY